ncbi:hypothetical protein Nepgr_006266 [Nepenthes gracilis]|uniref:Uncharacterized protein n=1 Tax=Nepenthes gracilis TaxID=150966 RepID=A0AAD3S5B3_NEPGR|nr:hypothetical protein Nepgr_006266 [Nepenthes gracilis]
MVRLLPRLFSCRPLGCRMMGLIFEKKFRSHQYYDQRFTDVMRKRTSRSNKMLPLPPPVGEHIQFNLEMELVGHSMVNPYLHGSITSM